MSLGCFVNMLQRVQLFVLAASDKRTIMQQRQLVAVNYLVLHRRPWNTNTIPHLHNKTKTNLSIYPIFDGLYTRYNNYFYCLFFERINPLYAFHHCWSGQQTIVLLKGSILGLKFTFMSTTFHMLHKIPLHCTPVL